MLIIAIENAQKELREIVQKLAERVGEDIALDAAIHVSKEWVQRLAEIDSQKAQ